MNRKKRIRSTSLGMMLVFSWACVSSVEAQVVRTFVATYGSDNESCSRSAPCRTFAAAIEVVGSGGEVLPLDSGGYSPFIITKSVSIIVPKEVHAAVAPTSGTAVRIQALPEDVITIRGLFVNKHGSASTGINFESGRALYLERCQISGFNTGFRVARFVGTDPIVVTIRDSTFREGQDGIVLSHLAEGGRLDVALENCRFENNSFGSVNASDNTRLVATNVVTTGGFNGFFLEGLLRPVSATLNLCGASAGGSGVSVGNNATVRLSECAIVYNGTGVNIVGTGAAYSLRNNLIEKNGTDVAGTLNVISGK